MADPGFELSGDPGFLEWFDLRISLALPYFHYFNFYFFAIRGVRVPRALPPDPPPDNISMPFGRISVPGVVFCLISRGILKKAPPTTETTNAYQRISAWERDVLLCCVVNTRSSCCFFCLEIPRIFRNFNNFSLLILRILLGTWPECY